MATAGWLAPSGASLLEEQMEKVKDSLLVTERYAEQLQDQVQKLQNLMSSSASPLPFTAGGGGRHALFVEGSGRLASTGLSTSQLADLGAAAWERLAAALPSRARNALAATSSSCSRAVVAFAPRPLRADLATPLAPLAPLAPLTPLASSTLAATVSARSAVLSPPVAPASPAPVLVAIAPTAAALSPSPSAAAVVGDASALALAPTGAAPAAVAAAAAPEVVSPLAHPSAPLVSKALVSAALPSVPIVLPSPQVVVQESRAESGSLSQTPAKYPQHLETYFELNEGGELGEGSVAIVRRIRDRRDGRWLALKLMEKQPLLIRNMAPQVHLEVKMQSSLKHPNVLRLFDFLEDDTHIYMILELAESGGLVALLHRQIGYKLPETSAGWLFGQMMEGVAYLHSKACAHRDLKPDNVLLGESYCPKICDFGWCADLSEYSPRKTKCGTIDYMAPEILLNEGHALPVDIWCLGVTLYELLSGHVPFHSGAGESMSDFCEKVARVEYSFPPWISSQARHLVHCMLQRNAGHRMVALQVLDHPWIAKYFSGPKQAGRPPKIDPSEGDSGSGAPHGKNLLPANVRVVEVETVSVGVSSKAVLVDPLPAASPPKEFLDASPWRGRDASLERRVHLQQPIPAWPNQRQTSPLSSECASLSVGQAAQNRAARGGGRGTIAVAVSVATDVGSANGMSNSCATTPTALTRAMQRGGTIAAGGTASQSTTPTTSSSQSSAFPFGVGANSFGTYGSATGAAATSAASADSSARAYPASPAPLVGLSPLPPASWQAVRDQTPAPAPTAFRPIAPLRMRGGGLRGITPPQLSSGYTVKG
eukprot:TRINITY_DN24447_c0_g1_i2.p1 TRINITY_DN24447_c0_g1~~TRINITY_DN24447_c0_g1_i2.p1  ORF type:complete len:845 (-),score=108.47 TRINITY_DN24447_c0_g1_i2:206-2677(-)